MAQHLPRIALVAHGFPPHERTGVENHVAALARGLAALDVEVEVFAACGDRTRGELETWREEHDGYAITRVGAHRSPADGREALDRPGVAAVFGAFLDEQKIGVVHFHHVLKLGVGLIHEASRRGLPVAYTAHDFYALSSRYTLLAPDLSAIEPGDLEAEVRADLALRFLDRIERLGDHHGSVLAEQLEAHERDALAAILHGDPTRAGVTRAEVRAAGELRRELELRRREAFRKVDLFLSPTRFVADTLSRAGLGGVPVEIDPYGIDLAPFERFNAPKAARNVAGGVSFGYLGGLLKHKGVHVLLDAFADSKLGAALEVFGDSRDRAYVELLRSRAEQSGARLRGAYDVADVSRCLDEIDVLVVPSIWPENAPFVIREAFAAKRPVIASRIGALAESVRDGIDGLLFEAGDASALRNAMRRVAREDGLLARLTGGIGPVHSIGRQSAALVERYRELAGTKRRTHAPALPAHLAAFAARVERASELDPEALVARVLAGLGDLGRMLCGAESSAAEHIARAWTGHVEIADTLDALTRERAWLRDVVDEQRFGKQSLEERARWLTRSVEARTAEVAAGGAAHAALAERVADLERQVSDLARAKAELLQRGAWLDEGLQASRREAEWLRQTLEAKTKERDWLERTVADQGALAEDLRGKLTAKSAEVDALRAAVEAAERRVGDEAARALEAEKRREAAEIGRASLERECAWQRDLVAERDREIAWRTETEASMKLARTHAEAELAHLGARLVELEDELRWRRSEMQVVQRAIREKLFPLVSRDLRWRARHWPRGDGASHEPEGTP